VRGAFIAAIVLGVAAVVVAPAALSNAMQAQETATANLVRHLRQWGPTLALAGLLLTTGLTWSLWPGATRWWTRVAMAAAIAMVGALTLLASASHLE
jgi:xanthine/uracil/vitamin C permease (AzgA family)